MEIKALACELPSLHGVPLSRGSVAEVARQACRSGLVATISDSTVWRWLHADAIRPDAAGAPLKVQQELMRHASITTTMNVYGKAMPNIKREANSKAVSMVLKKEKREPVATAPEVVSSYSGFLGVYQVPQIPAKLMIPLVAGARNVPNALILPYRLELAHSPA